MPIGGAKAGFFAAGVANENYFGDESLGNCQFGASAITQTGDSTAIDTVLTTGSESGGPGSSSYGTGTAQTIPYSSAVYEFTVANQSGTYDGDMVVLNFIDLIVDGSLTLTTQRPCRGMLVYCSGDCTLNGYISMSSRGGHADPTTSGGGDSSAVSSTGIRLPLFTSSGSQTLAAADFAGCGTAAVAAVANQDGISSNGTIFTMTQVGGAGGSSNAAGGAAGQTGGTTIGTGGGACGKGTDSQFGRGGDGGAFSGGAGGGGARHASATNGQDYGGAGGNAGVGGSGEGIGPGIGNPGGSGYSVTTTNGIGGIVWLVVKGDLTIGAAGGVVADSPKGYGSSHYNGGGAGGGSIFVLYAGTLSNSGVIEAQGGPSGSAGHNHYGGTGGEGGTHSMQIDD